VNPEIDQDVIKEVLLSRLSPWLIYLFGSASTGKMRPDSDIDIAFASDGEHDVYEVFMVAQDLAAALGIIDLSRASEVFRAEILRSRRVIYESDIQRRYWFELRIMEDYVILNERRKPILDAIRERGTIYN